jgi:hypothetical protein
MIMNDKFKRKRFQEINNACLHLIILIFFSKMYLFYNVIYYIGIVYLGLGL